MIQVSHLRFDRRSLAAGALFFALTAPFGIAAHLVSELAGLGWHDDADVAFSARHGYLALIAVASLAAFATVLLGVPRAGRRAHVSRLIDALPFGGRGWRFAGFSFVCQFCFFAASQWGEGCPLCAGDLLVGVVAAALAALLGALAVSVGKRHILELALALAWFVRGLLASATSVALQPHIVPLQGLARRRTAFAFRYRPPPHALAI